MSYEINVALNGTHFFATTERSITTEKQLEKVLLVFDEKFPESEGYSISATYYQNIGQGVDVNEIINQAKKK